jgi:hypothetical protein
MHIGAFSMARHLQDAAGTRDFDHAVGLVEGVCAHAGSPTLIEDTRVHLATAGVIAAVHHHDNAVLFDWLVDVVSYQGISDAIAFGYMERNGRARFAEIDRALAIPPACPKLKSHWHFEACRFHKGSLTCSEPEHIETCPLPRLPLRNGRLNRTAYSLFLFLRNVTQGDLVGWIDRRLERACTEAGQGPGRAHHLRRSLVEPLRHVHGVSDKVLGMALSDLLLCADPDRALWVETGAGMVAIDTLVHNWFHRTGIPRRLGAEHRYGPCCYGENGCAALVEQLSGAIDARRFEPHYPQHFPRFVERAIWAFCAQRKMGMCNGNNIEDNQRCTRYECPLYSDCDRICLRCMEEHPDH